MTGSMVGLFTDMYDALHDNVYTGMTSLAMFKVYYGPVRLLMYIWFITYYSIALDCISRKNFSFEFSCDLSFPLITDPLIFLLSLTISKLGPLYSMNYF